MLPPFVIERFVSLPRVESDTNATLWIDDSSGNEITILGNQIDNVSGNNIPFDSIDGGSQNPRMSTKKRSSFSRLQSDLNMLRHDPTFLQLPRCSSASSKFIGHRVDGLSRLAER